MASAVNPVSAADPAAAADAAKAASSIGAAPSTEMFLQLLVAQIKNQDPLNPADSVQFVSQLAQFSQLEQVIAIRQDIENMMDGSPNASETSATETDAKS